MSQQELHSYRLTSMEELTLCVIYLDEQLLNEGVNLNDSQGKQRRYPYYLYETHDDYHGYYIAGNSLRCFYPDVWLEWKSYTYEDNILQDILVL